MSVQAWTLLFFFGCLLERGGLGIFALCKRQCISYSSGTKVKTPATLYKVICDTYAADCQCFSLFSH